MKLTRLQRQILWFMYEGGYECLFINQEEFGQYRTKGMRPDYVSAQPRYADVVSLERIGLVSRFGPIARRELFSLTDAGHEVAKRSYRISKKNCEALPWN